MKRYILFALLLTLSVGLLAQKEVRKSIREGNSAYREQRYSAAETDYSKALEKNAASKEASFNLANTYYKQNRWDEALKEYQHYLTLENENPKKMSSAWSNMGNTFLKKKANEKTQMQGAPGQAQQQQQSPDNLQMSMEAYKNALRLNPADDETRENLAIVQKMIKDQEGDGGGGGDDDKEDQEQKDDKQEQQDQDQNQDQKDDKKEEQQQNENQMSQDNIQQILEAIEQQEKETQERVNQLKADERKQKMDRNRQQDKDW